MKFKTIILLEAAHRTNLIFLAILEGKVVFTIVLSIFSFGMTFWAPDWFHRPWKKVYQLTSKSTDFTN